MEGDQTLKRKARAIIVGINEYKDDKISPLKGAERDAKEICKRLRDPEIGNFDIPKEHFLTGDKADCNNIRKAISDVFWKTDKSTDIEIDLFYFSGHGIVDGYGDGYIAPYDIKSDEPFIRGINMEHLKEIISRSASPCVIMILDCCHSGIATEDDKSIEDVKEKMVKHFEDLPGKGRIIMASSEGDEKSKEITDQKHWINNDAPHSHGAFSFYLIEGLDGKDNETLNEEGEITLNKLFKYAADETEKLGKQRPTSSAIESGPLERIKIAISPKIQNDHIKSLMDDAKKFYKTYYKKQDISSLIKTATITSKIFCINAKYNKAINLKKKIDDDLANCKNPMSDWLIQNQVDVRGSTTLFPEFKKLLDSLYFDEIILLNNYEQSLLLALYDAVYGDLDMDKFIDQCENIERAFSQSISQREVLIK